MDKEKMKLAEKSEYIQTAKCIKEIEGQNLRLVEVLDQVNQTSKDIKLSADYTQAKINKELGRKGGDFDMNNFGPALMGDDMIMDNDMFIDAERPAH